jgi:cyclic dehypoxanthinyl futalosine synthase
LAIIRIKFFIEKMMSETGDLKTKILSGERITDEEALVLYDLDLIELGYLADERRKMIYPFERAGFIIDRIINYTNVCEAMCLFCAYHARAGLIEPYEMSIEDILLKVKELSDNGGSQVMLQGGMNPHYTLEKICAMVSAVKAKFPQIFLHSFSPSEIVFFSKNSGKTISQVIKILKDAGVNSVPGASDMLVDRIRQKVSPRKISKDEWCSVLYALCDNGMYSSATMTYGMGETLAERIEHLNTVRMVQDKTGIIRAFIPWSFSPKNTMINDIQPASGIDYLRTVAVARIYLDNIKYIQAGWLTEGLKLAQAALAMGANDMGGVLMEETVVKATGVTTSTNINELVDIIKNSGREAALRDSEYNILKVY